MANLPSFWNQDPFLKRQRQMSRLLNDIIDPMYFRDEFFDNFDLAPEMGWAETDTHYLVSFDIPGVKKDDLKIELVGSDLIITGKRHEEFEVKNKSQFRSAADYGVFSRRLTLPNEVKAEQIVTECADGVLHIAVPKTAAAKAQKIKIGQSPPGFWEKTFGELSKNSVKKIDSKLS